MVLERGKVIESNQHQGVGPGAEVVPSYDLGSNMLLH